MKNKILTITFVISLTSSALFAFGLGNVANSLPNTSKATASESTTNTTTNGLTSMLTNQLGITDKQASGGVGSILNYAKGTLSADKFSTLSSAIPDASSLMKMAPSSDTNALSSFTKQASSATQLASLTSQFSSLGLSSDMISKFIPVILNYFKGSDATDAGSILSGLF